MIVADVPIHELHQRLSGPGIALRTGFLVNVIRSAIPSVAEAIALLYSNHPLEDSNAFAAADAQILNEVREHSEAMQNRTKRRPQSRDVGAQNGRADRALSCPMLEV